jgi:hypothetical protein
VKIEAHSLRSKYEDVPICDIGDLHVVDGVDETMRHNAKRPHSFVTRA